MLKKIFISPVIAFLSIIFLSTFLCADELEYIQAAIQSSGARWEAGETSISKLPSYERRMRLGALKPILTGEEILLPTQTDRALGLPTRFDWRNYNVENFVTPVRNQGNCGSCWAFAATAALEAVTLIAQKTPGTDLNLAEQILVSSCSSAGDCGGGYPSGAANFIRDTGLPLEGCFPYTARNDVCSNACPNWQNNSFRIKKWLYVSTWSPTIENIKAALFDFGPLPTTLDVYSDFFSYRSGIYSLTPGCCNDSRVCPNCHYEGGHAVLIVGYDDEEEYFIVKNSWGTGWGESGYFKIDYSQLANEVEFGYYTIAYETEADIKSRLTVLKAGVGRGDIIAEGLTCYEEFCDGEYLTGATITVTAQAAPGYVLEGWAGCDSIIDQSCVINLTHDMTATATFLPPPRMYVTPRSLQFGSVKKGIQSSAQSLIVQNAGGARLAISSLEIAGTNGSYFSFQNGCSEMVFAGETCTINVTTTPAGYGKLFGEMKIYSNDLKKQPYHVAKLTANAKAPKIAVRPSSMRFEPILAGIASGTKSITLENKGLSDLMILGVNTDNISDFSFVNNCSNILEGGSSCTMDFNFVPIDAGTKAGSITINSNDPKKPSVIVKFTGKGE